MSWLGLFLLVAFLVVALGANVLAPFDPILPVDAINIPPWTEMPIPRNESYTAWMGNWSAVASGQQVDGIGMNSTSPGDGTPESHGFLHVKFERSTGSKTLT